jgi:hypothetical protein
MTNRTKFILLYTAIFLFFAIPYAIHLVRLGAAAASIGFREANEESKINQQKAALENSFNAKYPGENFVFDDLYQIRKATTYRDTTVSFFIYSNKLKIKSVDLNFVQCVAQKATSEAKKNKAEKELELALKKLEEKYGSKVQEWVSRIGKERFFNYDYQVLCGEYFADNNSYQFDQKSVEEFKIFLDEYKVNELNIQYENELVDQQFRNQLQKIKKDLSQKEQAILNEQLADFSPVIDDYKRYNFSGSSLGSFDYTIPARIIDQDRLNEALNTVYNEQYKDYSLRNGAMPYAYCYGAKNSGPSGVKINAGNSDVLVSIKNMNDEVVRHVYVKSFHSFTLRVPNGNYQVFFYYGYGWNPKRSMTQTICGNLIGGFLNNEVVSKDPEILTLKYQTMEYTLSVKAGGNFSTAGSSKSEAF